MSLSKLTPDLMFKLYRAKPGSVLTFPGVRATIQASKSEHVTFTSKFADNLQHRPRGPIILGSIALAMVLSAVWVKMSIGDLPETITPEWEAANEQYMKFQKMNPIFGVSSKSK